jgi:CRP/FNR family cyclic AMP-dependent transcriptional regulator
MTSDLDRTEIAAGDGPEGAFASEELIARARIQQYRPNVVILQEGDVGDTLYIILSGRVKVFGTGGDGREIVLDTHGPGECVGEMALDGGPRSASVMTLEPTRCAVVSRASLREHIARHPDFAFVLLAKLIRRVRRATASVKSLALQDVYGRVAHLLGDLAVERDGRRVIEERLTHRDIAERVGSSRAMVSRLLGDLAKGGYIEVHGRQIELKRRLPSSW